MKDFDPQRQERSARPADQRTFKIGGETFVMRASVRPEALAEYDRITDDGVGIMDTYAIIDATILKMIETEGHERYKALRQREDDPLTIEDLEEITKWLIGEQTGRNPTPQASPSAPTPTSTGTISTAATSSPEVPA